MIVSVQRLYANTLRGPHSASMCTSGRSRGTHPASRCAPNSIALKFAAAATGRRASDSGASCRDAAALDLEVAPVEDLRGALDRSQPIALLVVRVLDVVAAEELEDAATDLDEVPIA